MKKSIVILSHIIFWVFVYASLLEFPRHESFEHYKFKYILTLFLKPLYFYIGYLGIMRFIKIKGFIHYFFFSVVISYFVLYFISGKVFLIGSSILSTVLTWAIIGSSFKIFFDWFKKKNNILLLEKENAESKFALLRTQINPHFLYNTLHNIDSLIKENPAKASKSIMKLSDIMRYMLQDEKSEMVSVEKELGHLENYISLERLRMKNDKFFKFNISGDYQGKQIASMLLIPFAENAFKHSVDSEIENGIIINLSFEKNTLTFICENKYDELEVDKDKTHGIGLETVKKRLNILYPNKHKLSIVKENSVFKVKLEISLYEN